jgi:cytochrome c-type biogenesis protein CcmF
VPLFAPILVIMVVGPFLKWKRDELKPALAQLFWPAAIAVAALLVVGAVNFGTHLVTALGIGLSVWIIVGSKWVLIKRAKLFSVPFAQSWQILSATPRAYYGLVMGHMGIGLVLLSITCISTWQQENILSMKPGSRTTIGPYEITLQSIAQVQGPNYVAEQGTFGIGNGGGIFRVMTAERRFYPLQQQTTNQTAIRTNLFSNTYIALGDPDGQGGWTVRLYYHPMAPWLWLGGCLMALAGFVSLTDRRLRVGVAQKKPVPAKAAVVGAAS